MSNKTTNSDEIGSDGTSNEFFACMAEPTDYGDVKGEIVVLDMHSSNDKKKRKTST